jgi:DNA-binding NarL/FixJ family response regulator
MNSVMDKVKILLLSESPVYSYGISLILLEAGFKVSSCSKVSEITKWRHHSTQDILLVDMEGADETHTQLLLKQIELLSKQVKVVVVIDLQKLNVIIRTLIGLNVAGYMSKQTSVAECVSLMNGVAEGRTIFSTDLSQIIVNLNNAPEINEREKSVLKLIQHEKSNKEIAKILNCSVSTVEYYITSMFAKLSVKSRVGAIREAQKKGII